MSCPLLGSVVPADTIIRARIHNAHTLPDRLLALDILLSRPSILAAALWSRPRPPRALHCQHVSTILSPGAGCWCWLAGSINQTSETTHAPSQVSLTDPHLGMNDLDNKTLTCEPAVPALQPSGSRKVITSNKPFAHHKHHKLTVTEPRLFPKSQKPGQPPKHWLWSCPTTAWGHPLHLHRTAPERGSGPERRPPRAEASVCSCSSLFS